MMNLEENKLNEKTFQDDTQTEYELIEINDKNYLANHLRVIPCSYVHKNINFTKMVDARQFKYVYRKKETTREIKE